MKAYLLALLPLALGGCVATAVADAAVSAVTLPVKAVSKGVDLATTSQSEADEKRGRALRKAEEAAGKAYRDWERACRSAQDQGRPCPPQPDPLAPGAPTR